MKTTAWLAIFQEKLSTIYASGEIREISFQVLEFVTQKQRLQLLATNPTFSDEENKLIINYLNRLQKHEPIQYLLGFTYFGGLKIAVSPAVLIPRPETEELVYLVYQQVSHKTDLLILDCCTGSGCIALLTKKLIPSSTVFAWDVSAESLLVAQKNAQNLHLDVHFRAVDLLASSSYPETKYNLIVSNPPYVPESEKDTIPTHVLGFEPSISLFSPQDDPIIFYRYLALLASQKLFSGGILAVEHHYNQQQQLVSLFEASGFVAITPLKDSFGKERFLIAKFP